MEFFYLGGVCTSAGGRVGGVLLVVVITTARVGGVLLVVVITTARIGGVLLVVVITDSKWTDPMHQLTLPLKVCFDIHLAQIVFGFTIMMMIVRR